MPTHSLSSQNDPKSVVGKLIPSKFQLETDVAGMGKAGDALKAA